MVRFGSSTTTRAMGKFVVLIDQGKTISQTLTQVQSLTRRNEGSWRSRMGALSMPTSYIPETLQPKLPHPSERRRVGRVGQTRVEDVFGG